LSGVIMNPVGGGVVGAGPSRAAPTTRTWIALGFVGVLFVGLFFRWLWTQHKLSWDALDDWGHVYLIPFVSWYLIRQNWRELLQARMGTFWPGLAPFVLGIVSYFFFVVGVPNHMSQGFALILTLAGATLLLLGPGAFRYLFLPIAFLVFSVQISPQIMATVTFQLQLIASKGAEVLLAVIGSMAGFAVTRDGNLLEVIGSGPPQRLNVAEACSGMRMVIAFLALAAIVAVFSCRYWWQRGAIMLLAMPVAVLLNVIRVAVLGLLTLVNVHLAQGNAHMLIGMVLLVPGLFLFLGAVWALNHAVADAPSTAKGKPS
jgi:exosortase